MTPEDVLAQLANSQPTEFPEAAIREVMDNPAPYMDTLLAELAKPIAQLLEEDRFLANYACYLTAYHRDTRAYPLLMRLLRGDMEDIDSLFGDALTDELPQWLASVCGGELEPLMALIKDTMLDEYVRNAGLEAMQILNRVGQLDTGRLHALITELVHGGHMEGIENLAADAIAEEGIASLSPDVETWFRENKIEPMFFRNFEQFTEWLSGPLRDNGRRVLVDDPVAMAGRWACFRGETLSSNPAGSLQNVEEMITPQARLDTKDHRPSQPSAHLVHNAAVEGSYHRPDAKVGRNDPCPCGSGKKYKKCCGR